MKFNSELIKEKTRIVEILVFQLKKDIISDELTSKMLKDLIESANSLLVSDF